MTDAVQAKEQDRLGPMRRLADRLERRRLARSRPAGPSRAQINQYLRISESRPNRR